MRTANIRSLVPIEPQPAQILQHHRLGLARRASLISVFDADDESAAVMLCEKPVEDRRARATDVKVAGRRRCESNANGHAARSLHSPLSRVAQASCLR